MVDFLVFLFHIFPDILLNFIFLSHYLLAGYNNLEVAEYLLQHGADVNAQDKGGLIPLHNAASYGVGNLKSLRIVELYI